MSGVSEKPEFVVDFPTLGDLWSSWIERHCRVPDRHERGKPFREYDWQFWCTANHGRVRPDAVFDAEKPPLSQAFVYRRSQVIAPQKMGKGPWTAARICLSAVGPCEFAGWAVEGDVYRCEDNGCGCGFEFPYDPGEPMGMRNPSPLIQVVATSDDQVNTNIWRPLTTMISLGPLGEDGSNLLIPRGDFVKIVSPGGGRNMDKIEKVTSNALSRLGAPLSEAFFDETGVYTKSNGLVGVAQTMRRGVAAMGGRSTETTNAFDPAQNSTAQRTLESPVSDIFKYWRNPDVALKRPDGSRLSFRNARERRRILAYVYAGASHINLDSIEAECLDLMSEDPAQAERFFGNRLVQGAGAWMDPTVWENAYAAALADVVA